MTYAVCEDYQLFSFIFLYSLFSDELVTKILTIKMTNVN
jgi:hypothetical protein